MIWSENRFTLFGIMRGASRAGVLPAKRVRRQSHADQVQFVVARKPASFIKSR
jgi:hypothetical protein